MDAACNFPELLALDLETAESMFASKRMTSGAPRPMDAIFESQSIQDLGLKLEDLNLNDLSLEEASSLLSSLGKLSQLNKLSKLNNPAAVAYASSPRNFLPGKTSSSSRQHQNQNQQSSRHDHHSRSKSTTHAAPSDLAAYIRQYQRQQEKQQYRDDGNQFDDDNDSLNLDDLRDLHSRLDQRPTTASGIDRDIGRDIDPSHSPGPVFSISRSKTKLSGQNQGHGASQSSSAVPRYAAGSGVTGVNTSAGSHDHNTAGGGWDTDSVDSFELPNIRLSRRSAEQRALLGGVSKSPLLPPSAAPPVQSVHQRIQQQEEEQIQQLQQLQQLKQLRQLQQLKQQLQEKQQLQHLLEKQLKLQHEQEQKLKASHREAKEKESTKPRQKEQVKAKDTKEDRDCRTEEDDNTLSHLPQQPPTHLPATTQTSSSLLPQQRSQQQQTQQTAQQAQQQQNRLSVVDPLSDYGNRDSYSSLYDSYSYSYHRYSHDSNQSANTNTNTDDGASSININIAGGSVGGGEGGDGAPRGRQQSVVTMATSVSGRESRDGCRFSSQSQASRTTPSALGQYSAPTKNGCLTVSSSQRESVATTASSADRHVEFILDSSRRASTKATSDNTSASDEDDAAKTEEEDRDKEAALPVERPKSSVAKQLPPRRTGNVSQLSWMRFDDEEDEDEDEDDNKNKDTNVDRDQAYSDIIRGMNGVGSAGGARPQSRDGSTIDRSRGVASPVNYASLPPRPKTAVGHVDGASATDFRVLNNYVSGRTENSSSSRKRQSRVTIDEPTPASSINVPQRRSSLGHQDRKPLLFGENDDEQQSHSHNHKLRHFLSFSDASVFSDAPRGGLHDRPKTSSSSHYQMQSDFGLGFASAAASASASERERGRRSRFETDSIADHEDPPVFLQKTVYRKPVPRPRTPLDMMPIKKAAAAAHKSTTSEHLTRRGREVFSVSRGGNAKDDGASTNNGGADQPFVEPLLVSQFDDDSDSDHHPGAPASDHGNNNDDNMDIDAHLAENDAELFGDFEGAYNYDEGQDKIMLATMMPFSKQPPRSVRSIRSVSPGRPLDTLTDVHERPAIASIAALTAVESPEETSSHLQSWIEHASKSQLELLQQQQEQKEKEQQQLLQLRSRSSASRRAQEAFYEDDENDEARDVVAEAIEAPTTRARTARNGASAASSAEPASTGQYELQNALQQAQPVPLQFFAQPGTVGIPLPREVVETLRVSVSCFPETMLSLSSFSIQTIRTYSRKVRRGSQTDADSTYRLLMSPTSPGLLPPSPTSMTHGHGHHANGHNGHNVLPTSPTSPTSMTFDLGTGVSRSMTATSSTSNSSRRFWKLPKKISSNTRAAAPNLSLFTNFRSNGSNNGGSVSGNNPMSPTMGTSTPRMSNSGRRGSSRTDNHVGSLSGNNGGDEDQAKASGALKRIFPTGSDYLCDALYAHIIAFNYISLLCPPPPSATAEGASTEAAASAQPSSSADPVTAAPTMTTLASSATLFEASQQQRRQTIHVYVGSDVPLPAMSDIGPSSSGDYGMRPLMELDEMHAGNGMGMGNANTSSRLMSMTSSRPPSRGYSNHFDENDDSRMISRKAALLLGITETLEPDTASIGGPSITNGHGRGHSRKGSTASGATAEFSSALPASIRGSSLARRYNSMRRRMAQSISESAEAAAAAAADPNDHTFAARAARAAAASKMIIKNLPSTMGAGNSNTSHTSGNGKSLSVEISKPIYEADDAVSAIPAEGVPATVAATAASDASMRDLHAGLHACISQLVATMKLTTGQLGNTLLNTEAARAIDPLFLRTLCELVRSQEEQF